MRYPGRGVQRWGMVNLALCLEDKLLAGSDAHFLVAVIVMGIYKILG
jgi:hypothetical protein